MKKKTFIYLLVVLFVAGCNSNPQSHSAEEQNQEETHDHEAEEHKIQITAYSNEFELFAEADPLVAGENSNVLSHFTYLSDFSPLASGKVTLSLVINGKKTSQTLSQPTQKGIYSFNITPETTGTGNVVFNIETGSENYRIISPEVTVYQEEEEAHEAAEAAEPSMANATVFTKAQSWKIDFATALPVSEQFGQVIKTTAQVQPAQNDEVVLASKTSGMVLLNHTSVLPGNSVSSGETLFTISGSSLADNNSSVRFIEAKNNYEKAKSDYERVQGLANDKIVSDKELLDAKNKYENAEAIFNNLNENFSTSGQNVKSPFSGFITHLYVQNGEYVEAGQPVAVVSQNKNLLLYAEVQPRYAADLTHLQTANIQLQDQEKTFSLEQLNGKIISWGKSANHDNYLIPVNLQIENNGDFLAGSFVKAYLKTTSDKKVLTIANSALLEEQGVFYVFVQINPELFEKREIKTGATDGLKTVVVSGLKPTERVVTKGAVFIKLSQSNGALDPHAGHVH